MILLEDLPQQITADAPEAHAILLTYKKKIGTCIRGKDEIVDSFAGGTARYTRILGSDWFVLETIE